MRGVEWHRSDRREEEEGVRGEGRNYRPIGESYVKEKKKNGEGDRKRGTVQGNGEEWGMKGE